MKVAVWPFATLKMAGFTPKTRDCAESADLYSGRYPQDILFTQAPGMRILSFSRYVQFLEAMEPQVRVSQNHVGAWKVDSSNSKG